MLSAFFMNGHMQKIQKYIQFLLLQEQIENPVHRIHGHLVQKLLAVFEIIAIRHAADQSMTISEAMALTRIASSATLHKRINDLREMGMIDIIFKGKNRRSKFLIPSIKGEAYLAFMGEQILKCGLTSQ